MKNAFTLRVLRVVMPSLTKKAMPTAQLRKATVQEYKAICKNAKDIGADNPLLNSYGLAAWFIAMNRCNQLSSDQNYEILEQGLKGSRIFRALMGNADQYLDPKKLTGRFRWSERTHEKRFENDWIVDVLPGNGEYALGYDYTKCGVCDLCRDEGCFELAQYLCKLDYMIAELMGMRLERTSTLAEGKEKCDFRYHKL